MLPTSEEEEVPDGVVESKISLKTKEKKTGTQTHVIGVVRIRLCDSLQQLQNAIVPLLG